MTFGERVREIRKKRGMTQEELAKKVGFTSRSTIAKIESGARDTTQSVIARLADVLDVSPAYLIRGDTMNAFIGERLAILRKEKGLTKKETAKQLGLPYTTYCNYEGNINEPKSSVLRKMAIFFDTTASYLIGDSDIMHVEYEDKASHIDDLVAKYDNIHPVKLRKFPMLGKIACGKPIYADEDKESYIMADIDINADFCLAAKGDSMINARIYDGDIVFIREMPMVDNGDIAAVIIEDEATLKRVYYEQFEDYEQNRLTLVAENPKYKPLVYTGETLNHVRILGKAVYFMSVL